MIDQKSRFSFFFSTIYLDISKGKIASIWEVSINKLISSGIQSTRSPDTPKKNCHKKFLGEKILQPFFGRGLHWDPGGHWPKKIVWFLHDRGLFKMFFGMRNSLVHAKIRKNDQKSLFGRWFYQNGQKSRHFGQKTTFPILTWQGSIYMFFLGWEIHWYMRKFI